MNIWVDWFVLQMKVGHSSAYCLGRGQSENGGLKWAMAMVWLLAMDFSRLAIEFLKLVAKPFTFWRVFPCWQYH